MKVIIFGASGMVGEGVLLTSLKHTDVEKILVVSRRPCKVTHPKIKEIIHSDFFDFTNLKEEFKEYNACFFCLGVSSLGMSENDYRRITYDLTLKAAQTMSESNPDMVFCYVSGTGTDSSEKGKLMWARVKGKTENDLMKLPFKAVYNFRPGLMKSVDGQINLKSVYKIFAFLYKPLKFLFPNTATTLQNLGLAMINASLYGYKKNILENLDIDARAEII